MSMLDIYFVGLPAPLETNTSNRMALLPLKLDPQYVYTFSIILNQITISLFSHISFLAFFSLELFFLQQNGWKHCITVG